MLLLQLARVHLLEVKLSTGAGGGDGAPELHRGTGTSGAAVKRHQPRNHSKEQDHQGT